jgi:signal transduction histidine kinase
VVTLLLTESSARLEVRDDGVGFDPRSARERGGLGLSGMEERARRMGGRLAIQSSPGTGTRVSIEANLGPQIGKGDGKQWADDRQGC